MPRATMLPAKKLQTLAFEDLVAIWVDFYDADKHKLAVLMISKYVEQRLRDDTNKATKSNSLDPSELLLCNVDQATLNNALDYQANGLLTLTLNLILTLTLVH